MIPISDMIIRSICGYVFMLPVLLFYFFSLKNAGRKQNALHIAAVLIFCYYLFGILTVTGIGYTGSISFQPRITLIPFPGMISGPVDTLLNVVLFIPFGIFLPFLYQNWQSIKTVARTGFLFSLSVELIQMFGWGKTDINDLITNTLGTCFGFYLYYLLSKALPNNIRKSLHSKDVNDTAEVLLFIFFVYLIMVTVQPWVIHSLLNF